MPDLMEKGAGGPAIRLNGADNVAVALKEIATGTTIPGSNVVTREIVPPGYKLAIRDISAGEAILKYNVTVGFAKADVMAGTMLHNHNVEFREFHRDYRHAQDYKPIDMVPEAQRATFQGYMRPDGRAGTRNFIAILSTVNCSATVVHAIADHFTKERMAKYPNVDGVAAFTHHTGCGMEMTGEPMDLLHRTLAGYIRHPNVGGSLVVGLGCERCQIGGLFQSQNLEPSETLRGLVMQENGGTRQTIAEGIAVVEELLDLAQTHHGLHYGLYGVGDNLYRLVDEADDVEGGEQVAHGDGVALLDVHVEDHHGHDYQNHLTGAEEGSESEVDTND